MTAAATTPSEPIMRCPACGNAGEQPIRFLVDVTSWAEVLRERGGVLELAGPLRPSMQDAHARPRLECWALRPAPDNRLCGHRWEIPAAIRGLVWRLRS